jgi:peptidylprolyl isomerase/FKBP-type peptidyl-prolyl cis-trans isomerase FklB
MRLNSLAFVLAVSMTLSACGRHHHAHAQDMPAPADPAAAAAAAAFMAKNAKAPGIITLPSGLEYKIVRSGPPTGPHPAEGDEIKVDYAGSLLNGDVFDSTKAHGAPAVMPLQDLVPGWMQALPLMRPGDEWILYVPPALGYGPEGRPPVIPGSSVLVFDLQLRAVLKATGNG